MKIGAKKTQPSRAEPVEAEQPFSFGPRRYATKGPRRLFVPQKSLMCPVFEPETDRPHAILRVVSSSP